jgi:GNAT superfamily N-acetyltransferase
VSNIRVRKAMLQDKPIFRELWQQFMEQQFDEGSLQLPNEHNLDIHTHLFHCYVTGLVPGLVLFLCDGTKPIGIHMEGEPEDGGFQLSIGRYTMLWGDYIEPDYRGQGHSHLLYEAAMEWTYEQGFTGGITGLLAGGDTVSQILGRVVDGKFGATDTKAHTIEVHWRFHEPS